MKVEKVLAVRGSHRAAAVFAACGSVRVAMVAALVVAMAVAGWAQPGSSHPNRITQDLTTGGIIRLAGSVHRLTRQATDLGEASSTMSIGSMTLHFGPSAEQQIEIDALTMAQQDPKSPRYHRWLTQEEYGARFGLTDQDLKQVKGWLESQGLAMQGVSKSRNAVYFGGKVWQVESAFHTQLHRFDLHGEKHFGNATELHIPAALRGVLLTVRGLNDFRPKPQVKTKPSYTVGTQAGITNFLTPPDWATIYNVNGIYSQTCSGGSGKCDGTGAYVGVVGQTFAPQADVDHFRSASGLSATKLIYKCFAPATSNCTDATAISPVGDLGEADLDLEWAGGIAKNATVVFVYTPWSSVENDVDPVTNQFYDVFDALDHTVVDYTVPATGKVLPVVSMSYTSCEQFFAGDPGFLTFVTDMGEQASLQGQTLIVSSGDAGAAGCDGGFDFPATQGLSATVPVDSPNFTGVGGTTLSGDEGNPALYWNQTLGLVNSALGYIPETVWNDSVGQLATSGGGVSQYFAKPTWQPVPGNFTGGTPMRFIPDVAFAASADHDGYMMCTSDQGAVVCTNGFLSSTGGFFVAGGTSAGAPSFAGMMTLVAQKYGPQGNINPKLYQLAADAGTYATVFHDVTSGDNIVPCQAGTFGCVGGSAVVPVTPGTMGFSATSGYDMTTGLGSINGGALFTALGSASRPPAAAPLFSVASGSYAQPQAVTITDSTPGALIYYTTDGSAPTTSSTLYTGPVAVFASETLQAAAIASGFSLSPVTSAVYTITAMEATGLSSSSATKGGAGFVLTVHGGNFATNSKVLWNGALLATVFVNSTQLTATVPTSFLTKEGTALITVSNPAPNAATSAALPFVVISATPVATITGGSLTVAADGSGNRVLTLTGTDFVPASVARWNGTPLTASVLSPWQISAIVTAAENAARPAALTVTNPSGTSATFTLR